MSIFNLSGLKVKNNGGVVKNAGNPTRNDISNSSTSNTVVNGGSIIVASNNTDPAYDDGVFAFNNNKPLYMPYTNTLAGIEDKKINGNKPIENRSRTIRSTLTATAIREGKYNYFNNTFDTNYPENTSYNLCANVFTTTYQTGKQTPAVRNDNPSDCDQFYVAPAPTIVGYVADSSFGAGAGTYCPAGTYGGEPYYTNGNGWILFYEYTSEFVWYLIQAATPGDFTNMETSYYSTRSPSADWIGWLDSVNNSVSNLVGGTVCFE